MHLVASALLAALVTAAPTATPAAAPSMVHVRVNGASADEVSVDLPIATARAALDMAGKQAVGGGRIKVHGVDVSLAELRAAWKTLRVMGGPLVTVKEADQTIRIGLEGDSMKIHVKGAAEEVRVEVPAKVVDALLAGQGDTVELGAAIDAIMKHGAGDIVRIADGTQKIRVWID